MVAVVFDGRKNANKKELELKKRVEQLRVRGVVPKLVWISIGDVEQNELYGRVKRRVAERLGIGFEKKEYKNSEFSIQNSEWLLKKIIGDIMELNKDPLVHGVMVQLPIKLPVISYQLQVEKNIKDRIQNSELLMRIF